VVLYHPSLRALSTSLFGLTTSFAYVALEPLDKGFVPVILSAVKPMRYTYRNYFC
jgi:hypothetical protein